MKKAGRVTQNPIVTTDITMFLHRLCAAKPSRLSAIQTRLTFSVHDDGCLCVHCPSTLRLVPYVVYKVTLAGEKPSTRLEWSHDASTNVGPHRQGLLCLHKLHASTWPEYAEQDRYALDDKLPSKRALLVPPSDTLFTGPTSKEFQTLI